MTESEALDIFNSLTSIKTDKLMSYYAKNHIKIRDAAKIAGDAIRQKQSIDKLLKCWSDPDIEKP